jgi:sodium-dependent dicarboxylate transporter 2/3/5
MRGIVIIVGLIILGATVLVSPPAGLTPPAWATLGLLIVMALWWISEALPVTVTALLPIVYLPLAGTDRINAVAASYMSSVIFLVLGGALLALAMEKSGLHRRVAVSVVSLSSSKPRALILAFMAATAFVSMWISNTATTLIMMPIAVAVLAALLPARDQCDADQKSFAIVMVLGVAYAASIGGLGTLVGSPTNSIAVGLIEKTLGIKISFLAWLSFGVPLVVLAIPLGWLLLTRVAFRFSLPQFDRATVLRAIGGQPELTTAEKRLIPILLLAVVGWVSVQTIKRVPQLAEFDDATVAVVAAMLLFVVPSGRGGTLLEWRDTQRAPWDVLFLFGGGLALAEAITTTGLGKWIGGELGALGTLPLLAIILILTLIVIAVTEFASNVAAASSFVPVVAGVAGVMQTDPLWLVIPAALASSWGFMMPAGTPPNAIAYGTGYVRVRDMVRGGIWIDLLGLVAIPAATWFALSYFLR